MNFLKLLVESNNSPNTKSVTVAFLGDSVTQGVFELYKSSENSFGGIYDYESVYHSKFKKMLNILFASARINIINAGVNGTDATFGLERLERDVLKFSPDLVVVCFGLNDSVRGIDSIEKYADALGKIFQTLNREKIETIFMTPNTMADRIELAVADLPLLHDTAKKIVGTQNNRTMDKYMERAREVCLENKVPICDCYAKWLKMREKGVDTTALLCNHLNHPIRQMHDLFAASLLETIFK